MTRHAVDLCQSFLGHLTAGDLKSAIAMSSLDRRISEPPQLPYGGDYVGSAGFVGLVKRLNAEFELHIADVSLHDCGDFVSARIDVTVRSRLSQRSTRTSVVELYTFRDGLLVEHDIYYKDPGAVTALTADNAGAGHESGDRRG